MARVCQLTDDLKYYLCMEPVDMRKQFQGLQGIVNEEFGRYLTQDEAFIFIGKTRKTAKVAKTEHSHPLGMVVSTHFRCGKGVKRGLKNGALPFNID